MVEVTNHNACKLPWVQGHYVTDLHVAKCSQLKLVKETETPLQKYLLNVYARISNVMPSFVLQISPEKIFVQLPISS